MEKQTLHIPNISCGHCVNAIVEELKDLDGIKNIEGSPEDKSITILWESPLTLETIKEQLEKINYPIG